MLSKEFEVRFYETDALQHVSNTVLVGWFESARMEIFRFFTPDLDLQNWPLILASYKVDFMKQIYLGEPVQIRTWISRLGTSSFDVYQEVWQEQACKAKGLTTLVSFDYQTQKSKPIDASIKDKLLVHQIDLAQHNLD